MKVPAPYVSQVSQSRLDTPEATAVRSGLTNVGQAISQVGETLYREGEIEKKKATQSRASDAVARASAEMRALIHKTQYENRGINAPKGSEIAYKGIDEIVANHRTDLKNNPEALEYFNLHIFPVQDNWKNENAKFTLQESDRVYTESFSARITDILTRSIQSSGDEKQQQALVGTGILAIKEFDARMGTDESLSKQKQETLIRNVTAGSIEHLGRVPGRPGYEAAKIYYDKNKHLLSPQQEKDIGKSLQERGYVHDAQDEVNAFIAKNVELHNGVSDYAWKTQQSDIKAFTEKFSDNPEYQKVVVSTLNYNLKRDIGIEAQAFANQAQHIQESIDRVGYIDGQTASMMVGPQWTPERKQAMQRYADSHDRITDNDTYQTLFNNIISAEDVHTLRVYEADMAKNIDKLSNANRKDLLNEIQDMRKYFANADEFYNSYEGRMSKDFETIKNDYLNTFTLKMPQKEINELMPYYKAKFRDIHKSWTKHGELQFTPAMQSELGRRLQVNQVVEMNKPSFFGEGAVPVSEMDVYRYRLSGKGLEGISPSTDFNNYSGLDVSSDQFKRLSGVVLNAMDSGEENDKMRAEMALDMLPVGKTYRQFKADYEMKYNNGRLLPDSVVSVQYIDQYMKKNKVNKAERNEKLDETLSKPMGVH
jgi:hypothetical protein